MRPAIAAGHRRRSHARLAAALTGLLCLAGAAYLTLAAGDAAQVERADRAGAAGQLRQALATAREVEREPARTRALVVQAYALRELGRLPEAERAFARALRRHPNDWVLRRDHAGVLLRLGARGRAGQEMARALQLNPRMRLPAGFRRTAAGP